MPEDQLNPLATATDGEQKNWDLLAFADATATGSCEFAHKTAIMTQLLDQSTPNPSIAFLERVR
jgi:hypothetical protein